MPEVAFDGVSRRIILAIGAGRRIKFSDLAGKVDASTQTIWNRVEALVAEGYIREDKGGFPLTRWLELTDRGLGVFRSEKQVERYDLLVKLGERFGAELRHLEGKEEKSQQIRKELVRVYSDVAYYRSDSDALIGWLREDKLWQEIGDRFEQLRWNSGLWQEVENDYHHFLDWSLGRDWRREREFRNLSRDKDDPEWDPSVKYAFDPDGLPARYNTIAIVRGNLDALKHAEERLHAALQLADECHVESLIEALDLMDLARRNAHKIKTVIEQTNQLLNDILEKLEAPLLFKLHEVSRAEGKDELESMLARFLKATEHGLRIDGKVKQDAKENRRTLRLYSDGRIRGEQVLDPRMSTYSFLLKPWIDDIGVQHELKVVLDGRRILQRMRITVNADGSFRIH